MKLGMIRHGAKRKRLEKMATMVVVAYHPKPGPREIADFAAAVIEAGGKITQRESTDYGLGARFTVRARKGAAFGRAIGCGWHIRSA